jgi:tyrosyl-tRNA synthetase
VQGYDFVHLLKNHGCKLQMGGDQWGNIVTGTELIRRMGAGEGFALVAPLITKSDGGCRTATSWCRATISSTC